MMSSAERGRPTVASKLCRRPRVNMALLPLKGLFFLQLAGVSTLLLYVTLFMQQSLGLSQSEIAVTSFTAPLLSFLSRPLFGAIADRYQTFRLVLAVVIVANCACFNLLLTVPPAPAPAGFGLDRRVAVAAVNGSALSLCPTEADAEAVSWPVLLRNCSFGCPPAVRTSAAPLLTLQDPGGAEAGPCAAYDAPSDTHLAARPAANCSVTCRGVIYNGSEAQANGSAAFAAGPGPPVRWSFAFLQALVWRSLGYFFYTPVLCLADAITMAVLGPGKRQHYGKTRLFGSLGFFLFSLITSGAFRLAGDNFAPIFALYSAQGLLSVLLVAGGVRVPAEVRCSGSLLRSVRLVCLSPEVVLLLLAALLAGLCLGVVENYVFLGVRQLLAPAPAFFGLMTACMVVSETPLMAVSGLLVSRLGEVQCVCIGFACWAVRFGVYSGMTAQWQVLLNELLHGATFGITFPALVTCASRLAPAGAEGTMQGLLSGVHFGLGVATGGLLGGVLLDWVGFRVFFRACALYSAVCAVALATANRCLLGRRRPCAESVADPETTSGGGKVSAPGDEGIGLIGGPISEAPEEQRA